MPKKRFSAEQIVTLLRQIEVSMAQGKATPIACRDAGISQQSYYRWRNEYGGLEIDQAKRMKDLERENVRLKRLVADLSLEKQVLKDVASGNLFWAIPRASLRSVLLIRAERAACMWRVSTQIAASPTSTSPAYIHCDSGPASNPIRSNG
jgi:putative transposase